MYTLFLSYPNSCSDLHQTTHACNINQTADEISQTKLMQRFASYSVPPLF